MDISTQRDSPYSGLRTVSAEQSLSEITQGFQGWVGWIVRENLKYEIREYLLRFSKSNFLDSDHQGHIEIVEKNCRRVLNRVLGRNYKPDENTELDLKTLNALVVLCRSHADCMRAQYRNSLNRDLTEKADLSSFRAKLFADVAAAIIRERLGR